MRILVASPYLPWPLNSGGEAAQFSTLKCLEKDHEFTLVCPVYDETGPGRAEELQSRLPLVKIRAIPCGNPPTHSGAAGLKRMVKSLARRGGRLLNADPAPRPGITRPFYPWLPLPEKMILALEREIARGTDLFQAEFAETMSLGAWVPGNLPKLFVHHQVHFVYSKRFAQACGRDAYSDYLDAMWKEQELACLRPYQGIITFSEEDRKTLLPHLPEEKVFTSPFPIPADVGIAREIPAGFDGRFLFVAAEGHDPNRDALEWLLEKIWPEISRQLPSAQLSVIGKWSKAGMAKYSAPGVSFTGFVEDLSSAVRGGIMLVPLRIGSGLRVKIMVAMAQGVPVVTTSVGREGMLVRDEEELLVRDSEKGFADAAVELSRDPEAWRRLASAGKAAVSRHYSAEAVRRRRNEIYSTLISAPGPLPRRDDTAPAPPP